VGLADSDLGGSVSRKRTAWDRQKVRGIRILQLIPPAESRIKNKGWLNFDLETVMSRFPAAIACVCVISAAVSAKAQTDQKKEKSAAAGVVKAEEKKRSGPVQAPAARNL
jgi:hypothetical protein